MADRFLLCKSICLGATLLASASCANRAHEAPAAPQLSMKAHPDPRDVPQIWDFYLAKVDDAPASIFFNQWFEDHAPLAGADTLYWVHIEMLELADHGMGAASEPAALGPVEDSIATALSVVGIYFVGRLRNHGIWQLTYFGPPGHEERVARAAREFVGPLERRFDAGSKPDATWSYYRDFLLPDDERRQWMSDRRVVEALMERGDPLTEARRVDHWIYFPNQAQRRGFVEEVRALGFELEAELDETSDGAEKPFGAQIYRVDSVQLGDIHDVVWTLFTLASRYGGQYDGWETSVEKGG